MPTGQTECERGLHEQHSGQPVPAHSAAHALQRASVPTRGAVDEYATPLFLCSVQEGHEGVVRDMLAAGCDRDAVTSDGASALVLAAEEGHEGVVNWSPAWACECACGMSKCKSSVHV